jgi:chromosome segregation ATPase
MAIRATVETTFGEERECYIRLNNVEASNHGNMAIALFRGYLSKEAFEARKNYVWEREIEFQADVSQVLWKQAYSALSNVDFAPLERSQYTELSDSLEALNQEAAAVEAHLADLRSELDAFEGPTTAEDGEVINQSKEAELQTGIATDEARLAKLTEEIEAGEERLSQLLETILPADELRAQLAAAKQV